MNKIIIPAAMLAVGVALVGSVSSTLAWYQYSTKAQAAYIGTSVGESEMLEIKTASGEWKSKLSADDVNALITSPVGSNILPISPAAQGNLDSDDALPASFYNSVETGVAGVETYGSRRATNENYVQFKLNVRYRKELYKNAPGVTYSYVNKYLKLIDLTIVDTSSSADLYKAVRVHFSTNSKECLFARDNDSSEGTVVTNTFGKLDTDNDTGYDEGWVYDWENSEEIIYGVENSTQTAINSKVLSQANGQLLGEMPASLGDGLEITVTIWLEGWQKLSGVPADNKDEGSVGAIWDPATYVNKQFKVGMRFQAEDIPAQNP